MAKKKTAFVCQDCGYDTVKWLGRCPGCGAWNTMVEETIAPASSSGLRLGLSMSSKPESIENIKIEIIVEYCEGFIVEIENYLFCNFVLFKYYKNGNNYFQTS